MPHTYAQNTIHVVFSTKDRRKTISPEFQPKMWAYAAGICKNLGILVHAICGMEDHVHFLIQVPPTMPLAKAVLGIKSNSSRWANEEGACRVGPHFRLEFRRNGFAPVFGAEDHMDCVLGVCVGHVSHLRRLTSLYTTYPALTRWANFWRAYGAPGKAKM